MPVTCVTSRRASAGATLLKGVGRRPESARSPEALRTEYLVPSGIHIELTRERLTGRACRPALRRTAHRTDHRSSIAAKRCRTKMVARAVAPGHGRSAPTSIVLGGDYVTWRDRRFVRAGGRRACAAVGAARCLRGPRQPRRRPRHAGSAEPRKASPCCSDARTRLTIRGEIAGSRQASASGPARRSDIASRAARRRRRTSFFSRTTPKRLVEAAALAVPLVLSGHTHGGQIVLPVVGAVAAREFPVIAGLGQAASSTAIFVSRGVGTV